MRWKKIRSTVEILNRFRNAWVSCALPPAYTEVTNNSQTLNLNSPLLAARDRFRVNFYSALSAKQSGADVITCRLLQGDFIIEMVVEFEHLVSGTVKVHESLFKRSKTLGRIQSFLPRF